RQRATTVGWRKSITGLNVHWAKALLTALLSGNARGTRVLPIDSPVLSHVIRQFSKFRYGERQYARKIHERICQTGRTATQTCRGRPRARWAEANAAARGAS